jgi:hypothetical protein
LYNLIGKSVVQAESGQFGDHDFTLRFAKRTHAIIVVKYASDFGQKNIDGILDTLAKNALKSIMKKSTDHSIVRAPTWSSPLAWVFLAAVK